MQPKTNKIQIAGICLLLIALTFIAFEQVRLNDFVSYDDDKYVTENAHVKKGLTAESLIWAFTASHASNWHPITWISHIIDCRIFELDPAPHHIVNLLFHAANTVLLFVILLMTARAVLPAFFVAAAFALHPLHVESVAWIAERKDVLSTFFWMLTIIAYIRYTTRPRIARYLAVLTSFALALMSKPMVVTLPFVLLLLDFWPLRRFAPQKEKTRIAKLPSPSRPPEQAVTAKTLIAEKIPLLIMVVVSCVITCIVQKKGGAMVRIDQVPLGIRTANAIVSYVSYLGKLAFPTDLAPLYPFRTTALIAHQILLCLILVVAVSSAVIYLRKRCGYLATGWFWYLGTLVPVIGIVQVGVQAMADRYTYLPSIGIFIMIAYGAEHIFRKARTLKIAAAIAIIPICVVMIVATRKQVTYWKDDMTLFTHACSTAKSNYIMQNNLGITLGKEGRYTEAVDHFKIALSHKNSSDAVHFNLANAYKDSGDLDQAVKHYEKAIELKHDRPGTHHSLGNVLARQGKTARAVLHYQTAIKLDPTIEKARYDLCVALTELKQYDRALEHLAILLDAHPNDADLFCNLGIILGQKGQADQAIKAYKTALKIDPQHQRALTALKQEGN